MSYRPYAGPDGVVYVLQIGILRKTAGGKWGELEKKLNRGEIPLARAATEDEISRLNKICLPELPAELASVVNAALSQKTAAPTSYTANSAPL